MKKSLYIFLFILLAAFAVFLLYQNFTALTSLSEAETVSAQTPVPTATPEPTPEPITYTDGFLASDNSSVSFYDEDKSSAEMLCRGEAVSCEDGSETDIDGIAYLKVVLSDGRQGYIPAENFVQNQDECVLEQTLYVRTTTSYYLSPDSIELDCSRLADKGTELQVIGFDRIEADGSVRMYQVLDADGNEGYIRADYLTVDYDEAQAVYDEELQAMHAGRGNQYGGGNPGDLDYFPRNKSFDANTEMPETCKTLYIPCYPDCIRNYQEYIDVADSCGINAFCVDICDGSAIAYPSEVMAEFSPACYNAAYNSLELYSEAVAALKAAGYYVIGRITTFNDELCYYDNMSWGITNPDGSAKLEDASHFLSPYVREVWQYKLAVALEAVESFGFDEIQFDYVRFPADTYDSEASGNIDFKNSFSESKAQAIQRFLMYAADNLHESGVWVSADLFGETSNNYCTHYGQYWPAISNVVDAVSAMPYPDHYDSIGSWNPWEHPYELMHDYFAVGVNERQKECPTPARVRTWIQCYDSIKAPTVYYYADNVGAEIRGLYDAGLTDGYLTWNAGGDWARYRECESAFDIDP